jgi:hypothetical protein
MFRGTEKSSFKSTRGGSSASTRGGAAAGVNTGGRRAHFGASVASVAPDRVDRSSSWREMEFDIRKTKDPISEIEKKGLQEFLLSYDGPITTSELIQWKPEKRSSKTKKCKWCAKHKLSTAHTHTEEECTRFPVPCVLCGKRGHYVDECTIMFECDKCREAGRNHKGHKTENCRAHTECYICRNHHDATSCAYYNEYLNRKAIIGHIDKLRGLIPTERIRTSTQCIYCTLEDHGHITCPLLDKRNEESKKIDPDNDLLHVNNRLFRSREEDIIPVIATPIEPEETGRVSVLTDNFSVASSVPEESPYGSSPMRQASVISGNEFCGFASYIHLDDSKRIMYDSILSDAGNKAAIRAIKLKINQIADKNKDKMKDDIMGLLRDRPPAFGLYTIDMIFTKVNPINMPALLDVMFEIGRVYPHCMDNIRQMVREWAVEARQEINCLSVEDDEDEFTRQNTRKKNGKYYCEFACKIVNSGMVPSEVIMEPAMEIIAEIMSERGSLKTEQRSYRTECVVLLYKTLTDLVVKQRLLECLTELYELQKVDKNLSSYIVYGLEEICGKVEAIPASPTPINRGFMGQSRGSAFVGTVGRR